MDIIGPCWEILPHFLPVLQQTAGNPQPDVILKPELRSRAIAGIFPMLNLHAFWCGRRPKHTNKTLANTGGWALSGDTANNRCQPSAQLQTDTNVWWPKLFRKYSVLVVRKHWTTRQPLLGGWVLLLYPQCYSVNHPRMGWWTIQVSAVKTYISI